jgi:AcrR family transcriptional regulator
VVTTKSKGPAKPKGSRHRRITVENLLEAADKVFLAEGFHGASLERIASEAGYTTGAVYSSFKGKADLFLAVAERRGLAQSEEWARLVRPDGSSSLSESMRAALKATLPPLEWSAALAEFQAYAVRNPELRSRLASVYFLEQRFTELLRDRPVSSSIPIDRLAAILEALVQGLAAMAFVDESVDRSIPLGDAVDVLLGSP